MQAYLTVADVKSFPMAKKSKPGKPPEDPSKEQISKVFAMMGRRGGPARAKALTPAQRKKIARAGAKARWSKQRKETES